ncbi:hypothetical protein Tco_0479530 [Tanacetum coccineum]
MVGDMGDLIKVQTCDNWKSNAIQAYDLIENSKIVVVHFTVCNNDSPIFVCSPYLYRNPDIGTAAEYQKALLTSLDMLALDKPHLQLENLLRRFIHESNPDDVLDQAKTANSKSDLKEDSDSFQDTYEHVGRHKMMQDLKISKQKVKRKRLKIKDHKA